MTLEGWVDGVVKPIMEKHPYAWLFFIPFIIATTFTVLNLFIGVIVTPCRRSTRRRERAELAAEREIVQEETAPLVREIRGAARRDRGAERREVERRQPGSSGQGDRRRSCARVERRCLPTAAHSHSTPRFAAPIDGERPWNSCAGSSRSRGPSASSWRSSSSTPSRSGWRPARPSWSAGAGCCTSSTRSSSWSSWSSCSARIALQRLAFFKDGWNIFDFIVVGISLAPRDRGLHRAARAARAAPAAADHASCRRCAAWSAA